MFYKHFEVYMYDREPVIVTGKSRAQVARDFKRIYGHDAIDEVKPISGRSVEIRYGFEYKQIVKANTMVNTPNGNDPYINEETMELKSYGFYEVKLVGTDETEIVIGSSLDSVKAEMEEAFGDMLDSVTEVAGGDLTSDDPQDPQKNHQMNVSILSGRNPFAESVEEMTGIMKAVSHPSGTNKQTFKDKKEKLKADLAAMKAKRKKEMTAEEVDRLNEISVKKLRAYQDKALDQGIKKGMGTRKPHPENPKLYKYVPPSQKDKEISAKRVKGAARAANLIKKKRQQNNEEVEMEEGAMKRIAQSQSSKVDRTVSNDKLKPGLDTYKKKPQTETAEVEEDSIEEKRGLWDNIHAKRKRIKAGSGERMRKPGSKGAPSDQDFKDSQKEEVEVEEAKKNKKPTLNAPRDPNAQTMMNIRKSGAAGGHINKAKRDSNPRKMKHKGKMFESDEETLAEGTDKLMYLARVGLMNKNELVLLRRAMNQKSSGQPISVQTRKILFKLLDKMVSLVIKNPHMFNQAKRKVMEDAWDEALGELQDKELTETFIQRIDYLREAGYMDQPKTKAEVKKKYPDVETDVKNKDSKEVQPVKYK